MDKQYAVVHFKDSDEVELVPCIWLCDDDQKTIWPPFRATKALTRAVKERLGPRQTDVWDRYNVRVLRRCETYEEGRRKTREAEEISDLQTTDLDEIDQEPDKRPRRQRRKRRAPLSWSDDDMDDEDDLSKSLRSTYHSAPTVVPPTLLTSMASTSGRMETSTPQRSETTTLRSTYQSAPEVVPPTFLTSMSSTSGCMETSTPQRSETTTHGHLGTSVARPMESSTLRYLETSTPRRLKTSTSQHFETSTPHLETSTPRLETRQITATGRDLAVLKNLSNIQVTLKEMAAVQKQHGQMLSQLTEQYDPNTEEEDSTINLPLQDIGELEELEKQMENRATKKALLKRLTRIGGSNVKESVQKALTYLLAHDLQLNLNWNGKRGWKTKDGRTKTAFGGTVISQVVTSAILSLKYPCTETEVEDAMKIWLRGAGDRNGGRKRRTNQEPVEVAEEPAEVAM